MNNKQNTQTGERLSFYKLFCEKQYRVSIPIIQRDYAQGRKTTTEIRNVFLDALYVYLDENKQDRDLDFVYGSIKEIDNDKILIILDGQQRITTLFLLHWYHYQISDNKELKSAFKSNLFKNGKSMFTYETRSSSSEFCNALMGIDIDFRELLAGDSIDGGKSIENCLSETIENQSWFFLSWKNDPTIQSMLTMLDAIHSKFCGRKEFFERLVNTDKPIITFLFLNLHDFKLTDDLYIKMNARGKSLTSFENFKAQFEKHLDWDKEKTHTLIFEGKEKEVTLKDYFAYNIDTKWANLFWAYCKHLGEENVYDEKFKNFIRVIFTNQYAMNNKYIEENFDILLGTQVGRKAKDYTDDFSYYRYTSLNAITAESISYLINAFDNIVNENEKIRTHLEESYKYYFDENSIFEKSLKHSFANYQERILFHAYISFLIENKKDRTGIEQWMRVIHNLANNTIIDGAYETSRAIKSIENLLPKSNDILNHLIGNAQIDFFSDWQVTEEKIKSLLIIKGDRWREKIENTEKQLGFDGQIGFILEFAGISEYYDTHTNCNWLEKEDIDYFKSFENYADKAIAVFKDKNSYNSEFVWERAVLSKGDYLINASASRKNLLSTNSNTRDYSWKRLLRITTEPENKRIFVKQVLDDDLFELNDLQNSLNKICGNKTNTWRDYLISCPELLRECKQGFIRFFDENDVVLLCASQMNHYHAEMRTLYLWYNSFEKNHEKFEPFKLSFNWSRSSDECTFIVFKNYCYKRINYEIVIIYIKNDKSEYLYKIEFKKARGVSSLDNYGEEIKGILEDRDFVWENENELYSFENEKSDVIIEKLVEFCVEIRKL